MIALDAAGQLVDAEREILLVCQEAREAFNRRTTGEEMAVSSWTDRAADLLGNPGECRAAVMAVLFPSNAQLAAHVLRLWAKDIKRNSDDVARKRA
ncbi:MAG TPA: hypothetical protein VL175_12550 [Pirellulales bacterium]|nr:hypothetical protein [Pirellulales bacterium]